MPSYPNTPHSEPESRKHPRIVIIGGGFGGLSAARTLQAAVADVVVIDRVNHHLFQPLLYQVATATLPPSDITAPIRWLLRKQHNTSVLLGEVTHIEPDSRSLTVECDTGPVTLGYDYLILAAGSRHSYFGNEEWEPHAPGLKSLDDALDIRSRFLRAFEMAEWIHDPDERARLLTFVVVGGGPTGVELAGILPEIARKAMRRDFRRLDPTTARVLLVEAGPRLLPGFSPETGERVLRDLRDLGVEVLLGTAVTQIAPNAVKVGDSVLETQTVIWAAGNSGSPLARHLGAPLDRSGRVMVEHDLSVPGHPEVFVVGDLAAFQQDGAEVPGVAQGAIQGGRHAARNILRSISGRPHKEFRYSNRGNAATIGRHRAVFELGFVRISGKPAWWFWLFLHILYLTGFRNRLSVLIEWAFAYFSYERGARLITRG